MYGVFSWITVTSSFSLNSQLRKIALRIKYSKKKNMRFENDVLDPWFSLNHLRLNLILNVVF